MNMGVDTALSASQAPPPDLVENIKNTEDLANDIAIKILRSAQLQAAWSKFHHSKENENPAHEIAASLPSAAQPELLSFVTELLKIQRNAIENNEGLYHDLDKLAGFFATKMNGQELPHRDKLPEDYQRILDVMERQTGQNKFRPVKATKKMARHTWEELKEAGQKHPYAFGMLMSTSIAALTFLNLKMGATTTYIDPAYTGLTDFEIDDDGNLVEFAIDPSQISYDLEPSCHDHIAQISQTLADTIDAIGVSLPQHCSKQMTIAVDAQDIMQFGYDTIKTPFEWLVQNPIQSLGSGDSHFMVAFNSAAQNVSEWVYQINTVENFVLHPIMLAAGFYGVLKCASWNTAQWRELRNGVSDFAHRAASARPLNYLFGVAASGGSYIANNGVSMDMVWMGLTGIITGSLIHKYYARKSAKERVKDMTSKARDCLKEFSKVAQNIKLSEIEPVKKIKNMGKKITIGAVSLSSYASLVFADTQGYIDKIDSELMRAILNNSAEVAGSVTATALVIGGFLPYNLVEDAVQHVAFSSVGIASALPLVPVVAGYQYYKNRNLSPDI